MVRFKVRDVLGPTNKVMLILFYTIVIWAMYCLSTYYALISTGITLKWYQVCILLISTTFAISIPAAPAYVGTYHAAVVYVLTSFFAIKGRANAVERGYLP